MRILPIVVCMYPVSMLRSSLFGFGGAGVVLGNRTVDGTGTVMKTEMRVFLSLLGMHGIS